MSADKTTPASSAEMPVRWAAEPLRGSSAERRAAQLFRAAIHAPARKRADLSLVHAKLRRAWIDDEALRPRRLGFTFFTARVVIASLTIVLLASSFVGAAVWWHRQARISSPNTRPLDDRAPRQGGEDSPRARAFHRSHTTSPPEALATEVPAPPVKELAGEPPAAPIREGVHGYAMNAPRSPAQSAAKSAAKNESKVSSPASAISAVAAMAPPISDAAAQAALLANGLRLLHRRHDATAAIVVFNDYQSRFPHGMFGEEVNAALAEAYLAGARDSDALSILEEWSPATGERRRARLTLRGELRARAGRCQEAVGDFDAVLAPSGRGPLHERASFGRAICLERLGHAAGARDAFAAYIVTFPNGRFAVEARKHLRR